MNAKPITTRNLVFSVIILSALLAFEAFNYSTTEFALYNLLGNISFLGRQWATILAILFCVIDFAGIAHLFTPEHKERTEKGHIFGPWLLIATINAIIIWWGIRVSLVSTPPAFSTETVIILPVFVALMVWLIRILIIGSLLYAGDSRFLNPKRKIT
jgi:hypothetical protein